MKSLIDRDGALSRGLADIRVQFQVPTGFPADVLAEAETRAVTGNHDIAFLESGSNLEVIRGLEAQ